jgi:glutathione S-transferase
MNQVYTAAVTQLALLLYLIVSLNVGEARRKYEVRAPATTGNEHFERAYRVQMNTLEQMAFFLPSLWLCAIFLSDLAAAIGGIVWVGGRALYALAYIHEPKSRGRGMMISFVAQSALYLGALFAVVRSFFF